MSPFWLPWGRGGGALKCKFCAGWGSSLLRARELGSAPLTKLGLATGCGRRVWRGPHTPGASISVANRQGSSSGCRPALQKGWQVGRKIPRPPEGRGRSGTAGGPAGLTSTRQTSRTWWCSLLLLSSRSVLPDSLWPHGLQHARPPCPSRPPRAWSNSHPLSQWCHPTISFSASPSPPALNPSQHQRSKDTRI